MIQKAVLELLKETRLTSWMLLKITLPVVCITKVLQEVGIIELLSGLLDPVMEVMGVPGALGLVWATAMLTNLYGAIAVYASLAPDLALTTAQATIICSAMLVAHSLPLEMTITRKSGVPILPILTLRLLGAFLYSLLLNGLFSFFHLFQQPAVLIFRAGEQKPTLMRWVVGQLENFCMIIVVIFCVLTIMKILRVVGVMSLIERLLEPVLPLFGMSRKAAPVTVVGMTLGIGYGGALIIREANSGNLDRRDVFFSLVLLALCHSIIEDTLVMMALGAHWSGIFAGRIVFSLLVTCFLATITDRMRQRGGAFLSKK